MNSEAKKKIIEQMLRKRGCSLSAVCAELEITRPTLMRYLTQPMRMDGFMRKKIAAMLGIQVDTIDDIVNGEYNYTQDSFEHILSLIQPLAHVTTDEQIESVTL
jgi:lambda repressor-like predicted transcriptional regulator